MKMELLILAKSDKNNGYCAVYPLKNSIKSYGIDCYMI